MVHIRVDEDVKDRAAEALASMGLTVSGAVRILLTRIAAEQAFPFDLRTPNLAALAALDAEEHRQLSALGQRPGASASTPCRSGA
jgi:DNA-damage-inducible protein J